MDEILALDRRLKELGHNPGTSADLTVATVFSMRLLGAAPQTHGFADVFEIGVPTFRRAMERWNDWLWATAAVHFAVMAAFHDTHIFRQHGGEAAEDAQRAAAAIHSRLEKVDDPAVMMDEIFMLDRRLKEQGHNPGTSADLTVATIFAVRLSSLIAPG
jgi:triphosphoribosyl-dephospho-CoA synthase